VKRIVERGGMRGGGGCILTEALNESRGEEKTNGSSNHFGVGPARWGVKAREKTLIAEGGRMEQGGEDAAGGGVGSARFTVFHHASFRGGKRKALLGEAQKRGETINNEVSLRGGAMLCLKSNKQNLDKSNDNWNHKEGAARL